MASYDRDRTSSRPSPTSRRRGRHGLHRVGDGPGRGGRGEAADDEPEAHQEEHAGRGQGLVPDQREEAQPDPEQGHAAADGPRQQHPPRHAEQHRRRVGAVGVRQRHGRPQHALRQDVRQRRRRHPAERRGEGDLPSQAGREGHVDRAEQQHGDRPDGAARPGEQQRCAQGGPALLGPARLAGPEPVGHRLQGAPPDDPPQDERDRHEDHEGQRVDRLQPVGVEVVDGGHQQSAEEDVDDERSAQVRQRDPEGQHPVAPGRQGGSGAHPSSPAACRPAAAAATKATGSSSRPRPIVDRSSCRRTSTRPVSSTSTSRCRAKGAGSTRWRHDDGTARSAAARATRPYAVRAVVADAPVARARVGLRHPQHPDRARAEDRGGVDGLADRDAREAPGGPRPEVAGALRDDDDLRALHADGGEQPGVQRHRLQVAAEGLPDGDRAGQPRPQGGDRAAQPQRQRTAVGHHVRDAGAGARLQHAGEHGRQRRVQVGDDDRRAGQRVVARQHGVRRRVLLVGAEHHGLQRRVPRLDEVARARRRRAAAGPGARRPARTRRCRARAPAPRC